MGSRAWPDGVTGMALGPPLRLFFNQVVGCSGGAFAFLRLYRIDCAGRQLHLDRLLEAAAADGGGEEAVAAQNLKTSAAGPLAG